MDICMGIRMVETFDRDVVLYLLEAVGDSSVIDYDE